MQAKKRKNCLNFFNIKRKIKKLQRYKKKLKTQRLKITKTQSPNLVSASLCFYGFNRFYKEPYLETGNNDTA